MRLSRFAVKRFAACMKPQQTSWDDVDENITLGIDSFRTRDNSTWKMYTIVCPIAVHIHTYNTSDQY